MHELSICGSIKDIVTRHAAGRPVEVVHVRIGQLRQIVPETLVYCWSMVCADTVLAGSTLQVESIAAQIRCVGCGTVQVVGDLPVLRCDTCSAAAIEVVAGEEFLITSLELAGV